jgi:hypothetical protein
MGIRIGMGNRDGEWAMGIRIGIGNGDRNKG